MPRADAHRSWYRLAIANRAGAIELVAAAGEHLGAAIDAAEQRAGTGAYVVAASAATEADIPLGEAVGKTPVVALADPIAPVPSAFAWPIGIVPALGAPPLAVAAGYTIKPAAGKERPFVIEALVARAQVGDTFFGLIERLPAADNLEIRVLAHGGGAPQNDVWLTSRVNAKKVIAFLDDNDAELFGNGHVEIGIYVRDKHATLKLTEHKTLAWIAADNAMEADVVRWLGELHVPRAADGAVVSAAAGSHFHYRPAATRDRKKLAELLYRERLRRVATERVPPRAPDTAG